MKIELLTSRAGIGWEEREGEQVDLPREEALQLIRAGQAKAVGSEQQPEAAIVSPAEHAAHFYKPTNRKRGK
jgi:hypothetical protein